MHSSLWRLSFLRSICRRPVPHRLPVGLCQRAVVFFEMTSLLAEIALGNILVVLSAIVLPLVARKTRVESSVWHSESVSTLGGLLITGALGFAAIELMTAVADFDGVLRYAYVAAEIAASAVVFKICWMLLGPGAAARSKFRFPRGPVAHH